MVELSDPKGPYQEGISNSIFIIPGIIVVVLVGASLFLELNKFCTYSQGAGV